MPDLDEKLMQARVLTNQWFAYWEQYLRECPVMTSSPVLTCKEIGASRPPILYVKTCQQDELAHCEPFRLISGPI